MTLRQIEKRLTEAGIETASFDALQLASAFTGRSAAVLRAGRDEELEASGLEAAVERREKREPLQYILGIWEFMGYPFEVSPDCLIPRPETERLVETALPLICRDSRVADLCTGSGCIAVSVAKMTGCHVKAVDLFPETLQIARRNAERNGVAPNIDFEQRDVLLPADDGEQYDVILSNPPYVSAEEMKGLQPEIFHEPRQALTDEKDGLTFYRALIREYLPRLSPGGVMLLEHGNTQGSQVRAMAEAAGYPAKTICDYSGQERCTMIVRERRIENDG